MLEVQSLLLERGSEPVLEGVAFSVASGQALVLRGPNGSGKSTLLRALAGLLRAKGGSIRLDGLSPEEDAESYRAGLLYAGHLDALKPGLTARQTLHFWAQLYEVEDASARAEMALAALAIGGLRDTEVRFMSVGQKRRLSLARLALIPRRLWLLDEPTVSLDRESVARVAALMRSHCAGGGMIVAATHIDLEVSDASELDMGTFRSLRSLATEEESHAWY